MKFKFIFTYFFVCITTLAFSQQEASVWYFGNNAGIKFNSDGSVSTLTDGQLSTDEGCATISDHNGNLLFYTDGMTIWNKNHHVMLNGTGLLGHGSSTQSATIVQKPGSTNLFYVFTLDSFAGANGFRYSIVDMSLDSGLGAVTGDKNTNIYSPSNEKLSITKHANGADFWIVTHGWNDNAFYSHLLTSSGLTTTPVVSNIGAVISGTTENVWGYMKISPNGRKLAISNSLINMELFDFDNNTGIISNSKILYGAFTYGIEFSPNSEVLYATIPFNNINTIVQYDLTATDVAGSRQIIYNSSLFIPSALQLGPDNKIYIGEVFKDKLSVIENPDIIGSGCTLNMEVIDLGGRLCQLGLPPFVTSFFYQPLLEFESTCINEPVNFSINSNQAILNAIWDFGDGTPVVNGINPNHTYLIPDVYNVNVSITTSQGTFSYNRDITIYPKPIINSLVTLKQCDDNTDGFSVFNLTEANVLVSTNYQNETFTYFETATDAQNNVNPITNTTAYTNQVVSNDKVFVRVSNDNGCFRVSQLNLNVSTTQIPQAFTRSFTTCDDSVQGTNTDGISAFDFSSVTGQIQSIFPAGQQLVITYYRNLADALTEQNAITNTANYRNIGYPNNQNIYIRVDSAANNDCLGLGQHITLNVERIPIVQSQVFQSCDDNQDGFFGFNTSNLQTNLFNGLTNVSATYFDQNNNMLPSPLPNPFVTTSQTIRVVVTNNTPTGCSYESMIQFIVDDLPEAYPINANLTTVCDDEINPVSQDGQYRFDTSSFQSTILGSQTGMTVYYFDQHNTPLPSPLPNPFVTGTQNVRVEVVNPANTNCKAVYTIPFVVYPVPKINLNGSEIVCNELTITKTLDAGIVDGTSPSDYTYIWTRDGVVLPETSYTLNVNQEGTYTVEVTNIHGCSRTRMMPVVASDLATITNVVVNDLSNNNTITVTVAGNGNYVYSIDNVTFQSSPTFDHVVAGVYTLYVQDLNGCGIATMEISVLGIPNYFTPNGDGYHDYWNIEGIGQRTNAKILIFDRFGKLIKQISPQSEGWDGTFLGQPLPSSDYWYSIKFEDGRDIKGHFTLKR